MLNDESGMRILMTTFVVVLLVSLILLLSGRRVLVWEVKVNPGDHYVVPEYGNLGAAYNARLVCRYYTGRSILTSVYEYSPNEVLGKAQCPFIVAEE